MKFKQIKPLRVFVIKLERGEEVISSVINFCNENKIQGGTIQGIGTFSFAKIYSVKDSNNFVYYEDGSVEINEPMELVSALGNISIKDQEPLPHIHVTLALSDNSTKSGHLIEARISFAGEFFVFETEPLEKRKQGEINQFQI